MYRIVLVAKHANEYSDLCQCEYRKRRATYAKRQFLVFWYLRRCTQDAEEQACFSQASRCEKTNEEKCHANFSSAIKLMLSTYARHAAPITLDLLPQCEPLRSDDAPWSDSRWLRYALERDTHALRD